MPKFQINRLCGSKQKKENLYKASTREALYERKTKKLYCLIRKQQNI